MLSVVVRVCPREPHRPRLLLARTLQRRWGGQVFTILILDSALHRGWAVPLTYHRLVKKAWVA
jgi:hypothetical protein